MVGWQLCSNVSYPLSSTGLTFLPPGPVHLSLRLLKLDRGLHQYLLEAAYSLLTQVLSIQPINLLNVLLIVLLCYKRLSNNTLLTFGIGAMKITQTCVQIVFEISICALLSLPGTMEQMEQS